MLRRPRRAAVAALAAASALLPPLSFAPNAAAQPPESPLSWTPHDPTVDDVVRLKVTAMWRDNGVPQLAAVLRDPPPEDFPQLYPDPDVPLPLAARWAVVLRPTFGNLPVVTPYEVEAGLGPLPAGNNRVLVLVDDLPPHEPILLDVVDLFVSDPKHTLSLHGGRFLATVSWREFTGNSGLGMVAPGHNRSSGLFTFFAPDNWEVMVKVLDGCAVNGRFWVFVAAATSVEYTLRIEDALTSRY